MTVLLVHVVKLVSLTRLFVHVLSACTASSFHTLSADTCLFWLCAGVQHYTCPHWCLAAALAAAPDRAAGCGNGGWWRGSMLLKCKHAQCTCMCCVRWTDGYTQNTLRLCCV